MKKIVLLALATLFVAACAPTEPEIEDHTNHIVVTNAFVRATDDMSVGTDGTLMTGAFMEIKNNHDDPVTLIGGSSISAKKVEIHEVVGGVMRPKEGGVTIEGGATAVLKPGGNHVMLMGLSHELKPGDELTFTLEFSDGHTVEVTAPVKIVNIGGESYSPSPSASM
ncbi:MAG: putative secreted protein [Actinomycetota bacterium]|jgi:copper(I)-binding protein